MSIAPDLRFFPSPQALVQTVGYGVSCAAVADVVVESPDHWVPPSTFGSRLAQIRQAKGWNVKQAAEACGVPDQSWHNWEDGRSPRDLQAVAQKIAKAVPCHYVWLMTGVETLKTRSEKRGRASDLRKHLTGMPTNPKPKPGRLKGQMALARSVASL